MAKRTRSGAVRKVRRWCAHWFAMTDCFLIAPQRWVRVPPTCIKKQRHQKVSLFLAEDEGFDCRFAGGKSYGALGVAPSGKAPPEPCMEMGSNPIHRSKKETPEGASFLAEDEGFEPPQTESESGVLPLHKSSICPSLVVAHKQHGYYTTQSQKVKHYFPVFQKNFSADPFCALA